MHIEHQMNSVHSLTLSSLKKPTSSHMRLHQVLHVFFSLQVFRPKFNTCFSPLQSVSKPQILFSQPCFLQWLLIVQIFKNGPTFYGTQTFITMIKSGSVNSVLSQIRPFSILITYCFKDPFLMLSILLRLDLPSDPFLRSFRLPVFVHYSYLP